MTRIETERLILRETQPSDAEDFATYVAKPTFHQYLSSAKTIDGMLERVARWIAENSAKPREKYIWTIVELDSGNVIGDIRLWPEKNSKGVPLPGVCGIGYGLNPDYWGKGYMTEALKAVTAFAHDTLKHHRVEASAIEENTGSWKVMEKAGYTRESELRYRFFSQGKYWPVFYEYASVRPDLATANAIVATAVHSEK